MTLRVGSLFTGLGGFDLAAEQAGMTLAWQCEIDKDANRVLARHWPEVTRYADITTLDPRQLAPVDLICGGSPCQNLSVAGSREGLAGPESRLFFDFVRICDAFPDAWAVWENVPGVFSSHSGEDFATVLAEFTGYHPAVPDKWGTEGVCIGPKRTVAWAVLDAQWFGVAQRRRRVFLVGHSRHRSSPYEILLEPDGLRGNSPPRRKSGTVAPTLAASGAGTGRTGNERTEAEFLVTQTLTGTFANGGADDNKAQGGFLVAIQDVRGGTRDKTDAGQGIGITEDAPMYTLDATSQHAVAYGISDQPTPKVGTDIMPTFDANTGGGGRREAVAYALRADPGGVGQGHNTNYIVDTVPTLRTNWRNNSNPGTEAQMLVAHTLTAGSAAKDGVNPPGRRHEDDYNLVAHTLRAEGFDASEDGTGRGTPLAVAPLVTKPYADNAAQESRLVSFAFSTNQRAEARMAVRRLMPLECERLQGLQEDWTRWDADGKALSDSARYRLIGNAVAVPVVRWILTRIAEVGR